MNIVPEKLIPVPLEQCGPGRVSWCHPSRTSELTTLLGGMVFVPENTLEVGSATLVRVEDPKMAFINYLIANKYEPTDRIIFHGTVPKTGRYCAVGGEGFGYHNGIRVPHLGTIEFGADVEIGSCTCIDRGTLGNTVIGHRTKIDNLVHIAHNAQIGDDCLIVAGSVIGGSAVIGNNVFIGMNASIKNKVRIGDGAIIGAGAVVLKDVPAGETWVGNPARQLAPKTTEAEP